MTLNRYVFDRCSEFEIKSLHYLWVLYSAKQNVSVFFLMETIQQLYPDNNLATDGQKLDVHG